MLLKSYTICNDSCLLSVNSTLVCITESWCLTEPRFSILVIGVVAVVAVVVVVVVVVVVARLIWRKCKRGGSAYTPANGKNEMELEEIKEVIIKTCNRS